MGRGRGGGSCFRQGMVSWKCGEVVGENAMEIDE